MRITFITSDHQYEDMIPSPKEGDVIEVQLEIFDPNPAKSPWRLKYFNNLYSNFYSYCGEVLKIVDWRLRERREILIDCGIPVRIVSCLRGLRSYKEGDHIEGYGYLYGHVSFDGGFIFSPIHGKIERIEIVEDIIEGVRSKRYYLIEMDISPDYPKPQRRLTPSVDTLNALETQYY